MKPRTKTPEPWEIPADFTSCHGDPHWEKLQALYNVYRDYMKHEDDLLNQRSTWHLLIQGFLFTTLGVIGEWQNPLGADRLYMERGFLVYVLAFAGAGIAVAAAISINAANNAIDALFNKWKNVLATYQGESKHLLPEIAGGGRAKARDKGKQPAVWIPRILVVVWIVIATMSAIDRVRLYSGTIVQPSSQAASAPMRGKPPAK